MIDIIHNIRDTALLLLEELESGYLEVCKIPGRNGDYIRVPVSKNAEWYSNFCKKHIGYRTVNGRIGRPRTIIRRQCTINALNRIANGNTDGIYAERLVEFIEERIT